MSIEMAARVTDSEAEAWLQEFHDGRKARMASLYREYFATVAAAVGRVIGGADQETVIHEVFLKLLSSADERRRFHGGSFGAWITTVARNQAIDYARRRGRELVTAPEQITAQVGAVAGAADAATARILIDRFREGLPEKWRPVLELCFLRQLSQRDAAAALGLSRTTVAYQHHQIRVRLRKFLVPRKETP
jgi:RNA polymerase sigma-70 factor (ECF subfamily)